jgi:acetyl esterase
MPVDPQLQPFLDAGAALPPFDALSVEEARARLKVYPLPGARADAVASAADRTIPGPGGPLGLRVYTPLGAGPFPLLVFFHGGGFVVCDLGTHDALCRNLCAGAGCVVASVDYRLAPEHRFPAAPDDCLAATRWAAEHAAELGADPARVAVGGRQRRGQSGGGGRAARRDEGGPRLAGQLLLYPTTDAAAAGLPSLAENAEGYGLTRRDMAWFKGHYLADPARPRARTPRRCAPPTCAACRPRWCRPPSTTPCATRARRTRRGCGRRACRPTSRAGPG